MADQRNQHDRTQTMLYQLIRYCDISEQGYHTAAILIHDTGVQEVILRYAAQRRDYRARLQTHFVFTPPLAAQPGISFDKLWASLNAVGTNDIVAILQTCEVADFALLGVYDRVIYQLRQVDVTPIVRSQRNGIRRAWEHLRELQALYE